MAAQLLPPHVELHAPSGQTIKVPTGIFIDNEFRLAKGGQLLETLNPATGTLLCQVQRGSPQDIDDAVVAARRAYSTVWGRKISAQKRGEIMYKWAQLIEEHADELGALEALDNGKPRWMATSMDVADTASCFKYYAGLADKIEGRTFDVDDASKFAFTRVEPIGVCAAIIPWNYPMLMLAWKLGPALAAGNCVVLKPAEQTPLSALCLAQLSVEAGFPPGVINVVNGLGADVGAALSAHMDVDKIAFTGSTVTGRKIMEAAAKSNLKKVTLELGGKSPVLVFDDVDIEKAIPWVTFALLFNQGQDCTAGSRLFVQSTIYDTFVTKLVQSFKAHKVGDPFDDAVFQGPQVTKQQQQKILDYIESGKQDGATLAVGGGQTFKDAKGYFVEPTIFTDCKKGMRIFDEEIFGPVLAIAKFDTEEEAIELANDTSYGLGSGVFSTDSARCMRVSAAIKSGTVWVNQYALLRNEVPFGGMKQSGYGRELGVEALREYTQTKSIHWNVDETLSWPMRG